MSLSRKLNSRRGVASAQEERRRDGIVGLSRNTTSTGEGLVTGGGGWWQDVFLPRGYPGSVTDDYTEYQIWDSVQAFCSTINGILTTQAMLQGVGVGNAEATALGALLTWVIQDGTGMIGRILFAWRYAPQLDTNVKMWRYFLWSVLPWLYECYGTTCAGRLMADYLNDIGMALGLVAQWVPGGFTGVMCLSTLFKALCGVTGGSTRGALTQHFAKENNTGDVSAKDGSQETILNLLGMLVGTYMVTWIDSSADPFHLGATLGTDHRWLYTMTLFAVLVVLHLYANYRAVCAVVLTSWNEQRLWLCMEEYMRSQTVLTPVRVAQQETIFWWHLWAPNIRIELGVSVDDHLGTWNTLWMDSFRNVEFVLQIVPAHPHLVRIALSEHANLQDTLTAVFCACHAVNITDSSVKESLAYAKKHTNQILALLELHGWKSLDDGLLDLVDHGYRYTRGKQE